MDKSKFGFFIKEARKKKNLTQKQLADLLYLDVSAVSKWERGISFPDITLIPDICKVLEVTESELIQSSYDSSYRRMKKDAENYNKTKDGIFWTLNILYATAILVCFIVNLAVNHTLSWFWIVLASILCSYTFVPTVTRFFSSKKLLVFIGSTFIGLFLLFLTISLYTTNYWFSIAGLGTLLGYFIVFYPIVFVRQKRYMNEEKYNKLSKIFLLSYSFIILVLLILLLVFINIYKRFNLPLGIVISSSILALPIILGIFVYFGKGKQMLIGLLGIIVTGTVVGLIGGIINVATNDIVEKTYELDSDYNEIIVDIAVTDVYIVYSDTDSKVVTKQNSNVNFEVEVNDNVLTIVQEDNYKWYQHLINIYSNKVTIYISNSCNLKITGSTSDVIIEEGIKFTDVNIKLSTGDVKMSSILCDTLNVRCSTGEIKINSSKISKAVNLKTSTGDISLKHVECNTLDVKVSTGDVLLEDVDVVGDMVLEGGTSDIKLVSFDAENITITVSTGRVEGTIKSSKFFITHTSTGDVVVPDTKDGGVCKITTNTGDIFIKYE